MNELNTMYIQFIYRIIQNHKHGINNKKQKQICANFILVLWQLCGKEISHLLRLIPILILGDQVASQSETCPGVSEYAER